MVSKISRRSCVAMNLTISILRPASEPLRSESYGCLLPALQVGINAPLPWREGSGASCSLS